MCGLSEHGSQGRNLEYRNILDVLRRLPPATRDILRPRFLFAAFSVDIRPVLFHGRIGYGCSGPRILLVRPSTPGFVTIGCTLDTNSPLSFVGQMVILAVLTLLFLHSILIRCGLGKALFVVTPTILAQNTGFLAGLATCWLAQQRFRTAFIC